MQPLSNLIAEGERLMVICNACRYCEGYCAVFPAMERRLNFSETDVNYLANLCHNCAECYPKSERDRIKTMPGRDSCVWAHGWL